MSLDAPVVTVPKHDLLGGAAAGERRDLVLQLLACHQVMVALLHLHGVAQRAGGARDDGDLLHRGGVALQRRDERVADLVVGDDPLFLVGEDGVLLLIARDDDLDALLQIGLGGDTCGPSRTARSAASLTMFASSAPEAPEAMRAILLKSTSSATLIFFAWTFRIASRPLRSGSSTGTRRSKRPGRVQRGVEGFGTVGGGEDDDAVVALKAVHFGQKLVERLLALVVAAVLAAVCASGRWRRSRR